MSGFHSGLRTERLIDACSIGFVMMDRRLGKLNDGNVFKRYTANVFMEALTELSSNALVFASYLW